MQPRGTGASPSDNVDLATLSASRSLDLRNDPRSTATPPPPSERRGARALDLPPNDADGQCGSGSGGAPARTRSLLASMVGAELARDMDVYEGVPTTRTPRAHRAASLRIASRVAAGVDPRVAVKQEVADADPHRRRSIDVSSLASGRAAAAALAASSPPLVRSTLWRPTGFRPCDGVRAFGRAKERLREAVGGPPSPTAVLHAASDQRGGEAARPPSPTADGGGERGGRSGGGTGGGLVRMASLDLCTGAALMTACAKGREAAVRRILRAGVPASTTDGAGRSALTVAAGAGHPTRTSNEKSQVLWPTIPGEVAQKTRLCGSISQVEDLHSPEKRTSSSCGIPACLGSSGIAGS